MNQDLEYKFTELLDIVRELQRDSNNLLWVGQILKSNSIDPAHLLNKYGFVYKNIHTIQANVYDCISFLCDKITELESQK
jgi:hypothetical protein